MRKLPKSQDGKVNGRLFGNWTRFKAASTEGNN